MELAEEAARDGEPCVMLGPIIHNRHVMDRLARAGAAARWSAPEEVPEGSACHHPLPRGEPGGLRGACMPGACTILDATCPNVTRIHQIVAQAEEQGRQPGDHRARRDPPGGAGHCRLVLRSPVVLSGAEELENWLAEDPEPRRQMPLTFVSQTTSIQRDLGFLREKSKKRVYKRRNF